MYALASVLPGVFLFIRYKYIGTLFQEQVVCYEMSLFDVLQEGRQLQEFLHVPIEVLIPFGDQRLDAIIDHFELLLKLLSVFLIHHLSV